MKLVGKFTSHGGFVDLLAIDAEGSLHLLELKRDKTPREVIAQALDYGSWVSALAHEDVHEIFAGYKPALAFEEAFAERFGTGPPEELNLTHNLTVVASEVDAATERIVTYLRGQYSVPVNVVFFNYFVDDGREYLARTWLVDEEVTPSKSHRHAAKGEEWDGRYWYVSFGDEPEGRNWDDARTYGFVSAGGGAWYSRTIRNLPIGAEVFVCIPRRGYVGFGTVTGEAGRFPDVIVSGRPGTNQRLSEVDLRGHYEHGPGEADAEWFVPVTWKETLLRDGAIWKPGMFANQNSACKLRSKYTIEVLEDAFGVSNDGE